MHKQISLFSNVDEREVRKEVIKQLGIYKHARVAVLNKEELEEEGTGNIFPILNNEEHKKELLVRQIERALKYALTETEKEILERKYLSNRYVSDVDVYNDMLIKKDPYYKIKKRAIKNLASALRII